MTTAADLTPHQWTAVELTAVRVSAQCAVMGNFDRMRQNVRSLPPEAIVDFEYGMRVLGAEVRALAGQTLPVPCARCGHDVNGHQEEPFVPGMTNRRAYLCIGCGGYCSPVVLVPANVDGWAIGGRG